MSSVRLLRPVACPLCASDQGSTFLFENGFELRRCTGCQLLYVPVPPGREHLEQMYDSEQWVDAHGEVTRDDTDYQHNGQMLTAVANDGLDYIAQVTGIKGGRLLDIGCGDGHFMRAAKDRGGEVEGVELSRARVARARARGLIVHQGDVLDLQLPEQSFDVVSARDILSHVTQPLALIAEARRLLKPGGALFVQTGNKAELRTSHDGQALLDFWGVPGHLVFFGEPQLRYAVDRAGLQTTAVKRIPYLDWQFAPRLLRQRAGRYPLLRMGLVALPPLRWAGKEAFRRYWYRGRPEAAALWVLATRAP